MAKCGKSSFLKRNEYALSLLAVSAFGLRYVFERWKTIPRNQHLEVLSYLKISSRQGNLRLHNYKVQMVFKKDFPYFMKHLIKSI